MRRTAITMVTGAFLLLPGACGGSDATTEIASLDDSGVTTSSTTPQQAEVASDEAILDYVEWSEGARSACRERR